MIIVKPKFNATITQQGTLKQAMTAMNLDVDTVIIFGRFVTNLFFLISSFNLNSINI